jgi:hypothetical protein
MIARCPKAALQIASELLRHGWTRPSNGQERCFRSSDAAQRIGQHEENAVVKGVRPPNTREVRRGLKKFLMRFKASTRQENTSPTTHVALDWVTSGILASLSSLILSLRSQWGNTSSWPKYPTIYEINSWVWLHGLGEKSGASVDLGSVPSEEWDAIADYGFDIAYAATWWTSIWAVLPVLPLRARNSQDGRCASY